MTPSCANITFHSEVTPWPCRSMVTCSLYLSRLHVPPARGSNPRGESDSPFFHHVNTIFLPFLPHQNSRIRPASWGRHDNFVYTCVNKKPSLPRQLADQLPVDERVLRFMSRGHEWHEWHDCVRIVIFTGIFSHYLSIQCIYNIICTQFIAIIIYTAWNSLNAYEWFIIYSSFPLVLYRMSQKKLQSDFPHQ